MPRIEPGVEPGIEPVDVRKPNVTKFLPIERVDRRNALCPLSMREPDSYGRRECLIERNGYKLRLADSAGQRSKASLLIQRRYSWRGYDTGIAEALPHSANCITLEASRGRNLVGTLTIGLDSKEGLLADALYRQEIDAFRTRGAKTCELSRLAVDPNYGSKEILASLFHLAYIYGRMVHRVTDAFIEVNPRHVDYYKRMLGFQQVGKMRICERVSAPAVLLHVELDYVDRQIAEHGGSRTSDRANRSLYPYFFSKIEEEGLSRRILKAA